MFSIFINTDRNKRGHTCYIVAKAQIQTSCNFKRNVTSSIPLAKIYLAIPCCWLNSLAFDVPSLY